MSISRSHAAQLGQETAWILEERRYTAPSGATVPLRPALDVAISETVTYPPGQPVGHHAQAGFDTQIEVANESTLVAAKRLHDAGHRVAALNFASAKKPGGGFLNGARAQEESLARSSGLYACIAGNEMYHFHRQQTDLLYSDYAIFSPDVPIIRDGDGTLLERPYPCSFITCPAVNANAALSRDPNRGEEIHQAMRQRIERVLAIAARHEHRALVLGAWGCGVFGNNVRQIAELFAEALNGPFDHLFERVVFAILDWSDERRFVGPFEEIFAAGDSLV